MSKDGLEPMLLMLCAMVVFFTMILFAAEKFFGSDAQLFQVVAGLLSGFGGALLMRVKPRGNEEKEADRGSSDTPKVNDPGGDVAR